MGLRKEHQRHSKAVTRGTRWRTLRMAILERDGFRCRTCGIGGRLEVDHIRPVRTHPDLSYDPGNLQALCASCHTRKTRVECGMQPALPERKAWGDAIAELERGRAGRFGFSIPHFIRPSAVPVFLVCGPPGAGKSTLVRKRAYPADVIVDFDTYLKAAGGQKWDTDPAKVKQAFAARDDVLRSLATRDRGRAWVIAIAPSRAERLAWQTALRRVSILMLDVPADTCKARIRADAERTHAADLMCSAVDDWWRTYAAEGGVSGPRLDRTESEIETEERRQTDA
jgi:hypothetical protein